MFNNRVVVHAGRCTARATRQKVSSTIMTKRNLANVAPVDSASSKSHKVVVIGGGSAGVAISHQLLRTGKFAPRDIAVVDPATWHHFQPGWTLVGGGLKKKQDLRRPMKELFDPKLEFYHDSVKGFSPTENFITLSNGDKVSYEQLVVAPGIKIDYASIRGLSEALEDRSSSVSTIYGYGSCDKVFETIQRLKKGNAIFTQPAGVIKCAGAPQKIMWLAVDFWKRAGLYDPGNVVNSPIQVTFATGLPVMFGVPKYSAKLNEMREERAVEGLFKHDLKSIDGDNATFAHVETGEQVTRKFDLLHAVPKMGPHDFMKTSGLTNEAGYVDVDEATLQQKNYHNVWSCGDASSLPTSKTLAAITSQVPVLVKNLMDTMEGKQHNQTYDGYTSCPLLTEYGKVMLAEFKYGGEPKETFGNLMGIDQATPRRAFYHLKKDFFPWIYHKAHVKGTWHGPKGWRP